MVVESLYGEINRIIASKVIYKCERSPSISHLQQKTAQHTFTMRPTTYLFSSFAAAGILPAVLAAPAPIPQMVYGQQSAPVGGVSSPVPTVTAPTGSLYGDESLLGGAAMPSPVSGGDSAIVPDPPMVNGQGADADLGLYLDFNSVPNPQPIRGSAGQTDPGPRKFEEARHPPMV